jgi:hypothetical protein
LRGRPAGAAVAVGNGAFELPMKAFAPVSVLIAQ